jgi:D-glucuronyl C5-epimerase C-terminus
VRAKHLWALLSGALALAGPAAAPAHATQSARRAATHGPSVAGALSSLQQSGTITPAVYQQDSSAYLAAKRSLGKLSGTRHTELGAVLSNMQAIAAAGGFTPSRLGVLFLTLERNRRWWTSEPLLSSDERVSFPPSRIVWEYYPGQGIEIQWLATFGEANGYYLSGHENSNLRQLLGEVIPLASDRAGGIAWEYLFRFDGGLPPWTSGLSQGTALQVLARAYSRFKEAAYLTAAQQALGIFETPPPAGVRVKTAAGALYAEYTYAPGDRILNGFIQALVGLYDYSSITKDPLGLQLFEAGDAEARAEVPLYDTGAWSLYDQFGESNLNYHELLTEFLEHLCERTRRGPPFTTAPAPAPTTTAPIGPSGGASPAAVAARSAGALAHTAASATASTPIAGDQIYCTTAQHFTSYERTPPVISLITKSLAGGTRAGVQLSLSKISTVRLTVRKGTRVVWTNSAYVGRGKPKLLWPTPAGGGTFSVTVSATDPAGNFATASGTIVVKHH